MKYLLTYEDREEIIDWDGIEEIQNMDELISMEVIHEGQENLIPTPKKWTSLEFRKLFTETERLAIGIESHSDPIILDAQFLAASAEFVHSDAEDTIKYLNYLVYKGLLTEFRKKQILK